MKTLKIDTPKSKRRGSRALSLGEKVKNSHLMSLPSSSSASAASRGLKRLGSPDSPNTSVPHPQITLLGRTSTTCQRLVAAVGSSRRRVPAPPFTPESQDIAKGILLYIISGVVKADEKYSGSHSLVLGSR